MEKHQFSKLIDRRSNDSFYYSWFFTRNKNCKKNIIISGGTSTGNFASVTNAGTGMYTTTYTGVVSGSAQTIGIDVDSIALGVTSTITVVPGATVGLFVAIQTLVKPGDEVLILEPAYDSYRPSIKLAGGKTVAVALIV